MIMFQERAMRTHLGILPVVGRTRHKVRSQQRRSCNTEELLTAELSEGSQQRPVGGCHYNQPCNLLQHRRQFSQRVSCFREDFKYYFADFVRKGGTPPPLRTKFSPKKRLRIWGVPPLPPLRTFPRKMFFKKC